MDAGSAPTDAGRAVRAVVGDGADGTVPVQRRKDDYRTRLGLRLRKARVDLGLSLSDVQRVSGGAVSAPALSSYERADRAITAAKLALLAGLYGVPISDLLPVAGRRSPAGALRRVEFDMAALRSREPSEAVGSLLRFLNHVTRLRGGDRSHLAVRHADLVALAALCRISVEDLVEIYADGPTALH